MDEYRKIQETPAEKRLDGTSAGIFLVCMIAHVSDRRTFGI